MYHAAMLDYSTTNGFPTRFVDKYTSNIHPIFLKFVHKYMSKILFFCNSSTNIRPKSCSSAIHPRIYVQDPVLLQFVHEYTSEMIFFGNAFTNIRPRYYSSAIRPRTYVQNHILLQFVHEYTSKIFFFYDPHWSWDVSISNSSRSMQWVPRYKIHPDGET